MNAPDVSRIIDVMKAKSYKVFENPSGYDLNLVGLRSADTSANTFNDWVTVFYRFDGKWVFFAFPATTDPGTYYREHPMNVRGTAIMKPGQYRGAYMVGKHRGYKALQQKGPITVYRDADQNETLDTTGAKEDTGLHAVNIHKANAHRPSVQVGKWSAGCQVIQDPDHFAFLLKICGNGADRYGNSFTYTLLEERDF